MHSVEVDDLTRYYEQRVNWGAIFVSGLIFSKCLKFFFAKNKILCNLSSALNDPSLSIDHFGTLYESSKVLERKLYKENAVFAEPFPVSKFRLVRMIKSLNKMKILLSSKVNFFLRNQVDPDR